MAIIKAGMYRWNDSLTKPDGLSEERTYAPLKIRCVTTFLEDNITYVGECDSLVFENLGDSQFAMGVYVVSVTPSPSDGWTSSGTIFIYEDDPNNEFVGWTPYFNENIKTFIVTEDTEAHEGFYAWFTENVHKITFKFKKINKSDPIKISNGKCFKKLTT